MTKKSRIEHLLIIALPLFLINLLVGCASTEEGEKQPIFASLSINATEKLNPAVDGRASPLVIRVYQLSETTRFDNSDFFALYENDKAVLANEMQSRIELEIRPNESLQDQLELTPTTRYIAVLAAFRDLDNAQWKAMSPFIINENQSINIDLTENSVKLVVDNPSIEKKED